MFSTVLLAASALGAASCPIPEQVWGEQRTGYCELPDDVRRFVAQRGMCDHFRGEDPYDDERRQFLSRSVQRECHGTDSELATLKRRHRDEPVIVERLNRYEIDTGF